MKKTLLMAIAIALSVNGAYAKVGDTVEQTNMQFGKAFKEVEGGKVYFNNGLMLIACFDATNICQALVYVEFSRPIVAATVKKIDDLNIPAGSGAWTEIPINPADKAAGVVNFKMWASTNLPLFVMSADYYDNPTSLRYYMRGYSSVQGMFLMQSVGNLLGEIGTPPASKY
jgi:hypothetical protein